MYVTILRLPINSRDYTVERHAIELGEIYFGVVHIKNMHDISEPGCVIF